MHEELRQQVENASAEQLAIIIHNLYCAAIDLRTMRGTPHEEAAAENVNLQALRAERALPSLRQAPRAER